MIWHLSGLKDICYFSYCSRVSMSWGSLQSSSVLMSKQKSVVSKKSSGRVRCRKVVNVEKEKRRGPRAVPCGTPEKQRRPEYFHGSSRGAPAPPAN